jgi:hypothetical protein
VGRTISAVTLAAAVGLGVIPAATQAAVTTIGVDLAAVSPGNPYDCGATSECTVSTLPFGPAEASGGATSPVNGTITSFQLKTGAAGASAVRFRVLHPVAPGTSNNQVSGAGTSPQVNVGPFAVASFPTSLPVRRKDQIGLDCCQAGNDAVTSPNILQGSVWGTGGLGPLLDGTTRAPDAFSAIGGVMLSATVQIDDSLEILSKPKLRKGKVRMQADLPNPGGMDLAAKGGLLRRSSGFYTSEGPQEISLALTNDGRAHLREGKRIKAKIKVSYQPVDSDELVRRNVRATVRR